jgi:hypothetical protein
MTANFLGRASVRDQQRLQDCAYSSLRLADSLRRSSVAYPSQQSIGRFTLHHMCWRVWMIRELVSDHFASFPDLRSWSPDWGLSLFIQSPLVSFCMVPRHPHTSRYEERNSSQPPAVFSRAARNQQAVEICARGTR